MDCKSDHALHASGWGWEPRDVLPVLEEKLKIYFKHRLEQTHVCSLVKADLRLPDVDNEHLAGRQRKERALPLKVLVLATFPSVGPFDIHDKNVVRHPDGAITIALGFALVPGHPYSLGGLPPF